MKIGETLFYITFFFQEYIRLLASFAAFFFFFFLEIRRWLKKTMVILLSMES